MKILQNIESIKYCIDKDETPLDRDKTPLDREKTPLMCSPTIASKRGVYSNDSVTMAPWVYIIMMATTCGVYSYNGQNDHACE